MNAEELLDLPEPRFIVKLPALLGDLIHVEAGLQLTELELGHLDLAA